jgi:hypothetical protein
MGTAQWYCHTTLSLSHRVAIFVPTTFFLQLFAPNNLLAKGAACRCAKLPYTQATA